MACSGTCWATCGSSCSSSAARPGNPPSYRANSGSSYVPPGCSHNRVTDYGGRVTGCWCGSDCAGCGGCTGGCSGCSGDCTGCSGACGGSCSGSCSGSCQGCTGCTGYCKGTCTGYCKGSCNDACTNTCGNLCNVTCSNSVAKDAYEYLSKQSGLEWLEVEYIDYLLKMIQEEGRRRVLKKHINETLTTEENTQIGLDKVVDESGTEIEAELIKEVIALLKSNANKTISNKNISAKTYAEEKLGLELKEKAIKAYNETILINTTSQQSYEAP